MKPQLTEAIGVCDQWFDTGKTTLRYRVEGHGEPIILIHEMGGSLESWDAIAPILAMRYTVIRYDQHGSGLSEKATHPFSLEDLVDDLSTLIRHLGHERYHLVGAAYGCAQAVLLASQYPDLVASISMCAPTLGTNPASRTFLRDRATQAVQSGMRSIEEQALGRAWPPARREKSSTFPAFQGRFRSNDPRSYAFHNESLCNIDIEGYLSELRCPVLALVGRYDTVRPMQIVEPQVSLIPNIMLKEIDAAHFMAAEDPMRIATEVLTFLLEIDPPVKTMARLQEVPEASLTQEQRDAIAEATAGPRGRMPAPMRAWLPSATFARRAQAVGEVLRYSTSLEPRISELAIIICAREWLSTFEWKIHSEAARKAGLKDATIEAIRRGNIPLELPTDEALVLAIADSLQRNRRISDKLFEQGVQEFTRQGLAELIGIFGYYTLVSMTLNVFEIGDDPTETVFLETR